MHAQKKKEITHKTAIIIISRKARLHSILRLTFQVSTTGETHGVFTGNEKRGRLKGSLPKDDSTTQALKVKQPGWPPADLSL